MTSPAAGRLRSTKDTARTNIPTDELPDPCGLLCANPADAAQRERVGGKDPFNGTKAIEQSAREGRPDARQALQQEDPS